MSRKQYLGLSQAGFHRLSYTEWGDPAAMQVVMCVHGLTRNARDFDALATSLESRARIMCPDVVGRGESAWLADKQAYGYPQYLADMAALIARITEPLGPDARIDWVGTSMGGLIGMLLAAQPGNPIRRLVMNDIGPLIPVSALARIGQYVGKAPAFESLAEAERYVRQVSAPFGPLTDSQWHHLTRHNVRQDRAGRWHLRYDPGIAAPFAQLPPADIVMWEFWDRVTCPVLVLRGADSDLLLEATANEMTRRGPQTRLLQFAGIGHAPALMAQDQIAAIGEFLLGA